MSTNWFKRKDPFFIPTSIFGWIILLGAVIYAVVTFITIDSHSHSVSDTLMNFALQLLMIIVVYSSVAYLITRVR